MEQQEENHLPGSHTKRPVFLTIICLLSFVGIVYVISSSLNNLLVISASENMIEKHNTAGNSFYESVDVNDIDNSNDLYGSYNIVCIVAAVVCLAGVILMWKLKRVGYYLYIVGELAPTVVFFILFGRYFQNPLLSLKFMTSAVLMFFVAVAFITMYTLNFKRMS